MPYRVYFMEPHNVNMWDIFLENEILTAISRLASLSQYFFIWFVAYKIVKTNVLDTVYDQNFDCNIKVFEV